MNFTRALQSLIKLICIMCVLALCGCASDEKTLETPKTTSEWNADEISFTETEAETNTVKLEMTDGGVIIFELYPDIAPITVKNFKKLVSAHFYDGLIFHRVIYDFMIQTGDPTGIGSGGSSETIFGEFGINGFTNKLSHKRGVVSMARRDKLNNSASSQFFIVQSDYPSLDGNYAAFGKVIAGMDVVDRIAAVKVDVRNKPLEDQRIATVRFVDVVK